MYTVWLIVQSECISMLVTEWKSKNIWIIHGPKLSIHVKIQAL